jgi:hypothetical protein
MHPFHVHDLMALKTSSKLYYVATINKSKYQYATKFSFVIHLTRIDDASNFVYTTNTYKTIFKHLGSLHSFNIWYKRKFNNSTNDISRFLECNNSWLGISLDKDFNALVKNIKPPPIVSQTTFDDTSVKWKSSIANNGRVEVTKNKKLDVGGLNW